MFARIVEESKMITTVFQTINTLGNIPLKIKSKNDNGLSL